MKNTTARRQAIINILCQRRRETIYNLAFEFCVNERTIRRDLEILSISFPIFTVQGKGGGVFMMENYKLGMIYLTDKQLELLNKLYLLLTEQEEKKTMDSIISTYKNPIN